MSRHMGMQNVPRVFITQDLGTVNFIPAEDFGELVVCLDGRVSHVGMLRAYTKLREKLRDITENDWIVPVGHPAIIGYASHIMAERTGIIRLLVWDRQANKYLPTEVKVR